MRNRTLGLILILLTFLLGCDKKEQQLVLRANTITEAIALEKTLNSNLLSENSNGVISTKFLPADTNLIMKNKATYLRENKEGLSLYTKCYSDDKGNELIVYDWDKELPSMSEAEKEKLRKGFADYNSVYSNKYNEMALRLTEELGKPVYKDNQLSKNKSEVTKTWSSKQVWEEENKIIELRIILFPHSFYKVLLKQLILAE